MTSRADLFFIQYYQNFIALHVEKGLILTGNRIPKRNLVKDNRLQQQKPYGPYSEFDYLHAARRTSAFSLIAIVSQLSKCLKFMTFQEGCFVIRN